METIRERLGLHKTDGDLGIEIEVEGSDLPLIRIPGFNWKAVADLSLRGGVEYVLAKPVNIDKVPSVIQQLANIFKENNSKLAFSFRTSTHVHLNVQELSYDQLLTLLYTYFLVEGPMMDFCGESRKANRFCLRIIDAEGYIEVLNRLFKGEVESIFDIPHNQVRYSALNLESLRKFGSVEFRGMRGTMDSKLIKSWCTSIMDLKAFSLKFASPMDVYHSYLSGSPKEFLARVFPNTFKDLYTNNAEDQLRTNFSLTIEFPYSFVDRHLKLEKKDVYKKPIIIIDDIIDELAPQVRRKAQLDIKPMRINDQEVQF